MRIKQIDLLQAFKFTTPGILFYLVLDMFFKSFGFSASAVILLFLVAAASTFWITGYQYLPVILGVLLAMGSVCFLLTIGQGVLQGYFIIFASALFVVAMIGLYRFFTPKEERPKEEKARFLDTGFNLNQSIVLFSLFFLSSGIYGIYTITNIRPWQMTLIMFTGIYLSSYYLIRINFLKSQELELHLDYYKNRSFNFYSFLLALIMVELVWVMIFLPINPLTFGAIILAIFFSYWSIVRSYLRNELSRRKFLVAILFAAIATSVMLLSSKLYIN
ncbi:MAG: hypothetical protein PHX30_04460 [Candidatus Pacebacteria bacterium]|nr:hypothetical protein [Candidatus Paceibacterota bacterium]